MKTQDQPRQDSTVVLRRRPVRRVQGRPEGGWTDEFEIICCDCGDDPDLGPDIVGHDYTGWWIYIVGPMIGAAIAVAIIGMVRGLPDKAERESAQGGALPMQESPASAAPKQETA